MALKWYSALFWAGIMSVAKANNPCHTAIQLSFLTTRSTGYVLAPLEKPLCDYYLTETWYKMPRFRLATTNATCGTSTNWYMSGGLPTSNKEETIKVCQNDGTACKTFKNIKVKQCGTLDYVFYLPPTDGCDEAYCIESVSGPSVYPAPTFTQPIEPVIEPRKVNKTSHIGELQYLCKFDPPRKDLQYSVSWSVSTGLSLTNEIHFAGDVTFANGDQFLNDTMLTEDHLRSKSITTMGFTLLCGVTARKTSRGAYSQTFQSLPKFCGIEILTKKRLYISQKHDNASIELRLTVPFACPVGRPTCEIYLPLFVPKAPGSNCEVSQLVHAVHQNVDRTARCGVIFTNDDYEKNKTKQLHLSNKDPIRNNNNVVQDYILLLQTVPVSSHKMFSKYIVDPVHVESVTNNIELSKEKTCTSYSDPHIRTFDGQLFDNQYEGIYVLYKNSKHHIEVQTKSAHCLNYYQSWHPLCNKAIAVRAGRDIFIADLQTNDINFKMCEDSILKNYVKKSSAKSFKIIFPTGTEVNFHAGGGNFIEIEIVPSLADERNSEGLCGDFDGDKLNDISKPHWCSESNFQRCWNVAGRPENLFDSKNYPGLMSVSERVLFCHCPPSEGGGKGLGDTIQCDHLKKLECELGSLRSLNNAMCSVTRKKRDIHLSHETEFVTAVEVNEQSMTRIKRDAVNFTKTMARKACETKMNTTSVQMCRSLPDFDIEPYIQNCVQDVMMTETLDWVQIQIEGIKRTCLQHVKFNQPIPTEILDNISANSFDNNTINSTDLSTMTPTSPHSFSVFNADLLRNIQDVSCPNDCSGQGECRNGTCSCDAGFFDDDCSVDINKPPRMIGIPDRGKCDLTQRECKRTAVIGRTFVESSDLTCKLTPFNLDKQNNVERSNPYTVAGELDSFLQVFCAFPQQSRKKRSTAGPNPDVIAHGFNISVSNDGKSFSKEDSIVVFDSQCVDCTKRNHTIICFAKPGFCISNGHCYVAGDQLGCYVCTGSPGDSYWWDTSNECSEPVDYGSKLWVIGATVGPVCLLTAVITAAYCYISKRNRRSPKGLSENPVFEEKQSQ